ncbi:hypothetical protein K1T71_010512 [Dendrolimus kikuchii]|uniref:Uncharacterized protein n=1 Tax=Dendrolimus kikuchii TaxID=765133 RepID=A0ACC1CS60_9NEOP|nr:hypothetical protein K1T71_010512 [Dendrolimus kikuchii]
MAALPSPTQVAGTHCAIYEAYYHQVDPNGTGAIQALDAARFLKKSRLSDVVLSKIWDLSDPTGKGYLDKPGLFVALKLVALAQAGKDINMSNIHSEAPPPKVGELPKVPPVSAVPPGRPAAPSPLPHAPLSDWTMKPHERDKYSQLFDSLQPSNGLIAGNKVKGVLMESKLPLETLGKIWDLADQDKDGMLDRHEFMVIISLSNFFLTKIYPAYPPRAPLITDNTDRDGFVSGLEIKHTFLESGLPQHTLAHIWALCDMEGVGKLSCDQFALAMWLVKRAIRGEAPPAALAPEMMPPAHHNQTPHIAQKIEAAPTLGPQPTPEMEAIAREVDALARERLALEAEIAAKQRELTTNGGEADSLQSELDTLTATLKQLENQKGEAQKRLNDLKSQVDKLRSQVSAQEAAAAETEAEVAARRAAAHTLKEKERALQEEVAGAEAEAEAITAQLRRTVLAVSQANIKISHLEEQYRVISEAAEALAGGGVASQAHLSLQPQFAAEHLDRVVRGATPSDALEDDSFSKSNGFAGANGSDAFASDPFKDGAFGAAAAAHHDPFAPAHPTNTLQGAWESDPFAVLHAPTRSSAGSGGAPAATPTPALPPKRHRTPPPRPAPPRPNPPNKTDRAAMDFADDPFKDYRYEDPFNIEDPFADAADAKKDPFGRPTSVAGFETDDFFAASSTVNGSFAPPEKRSGRVSAPPVAYDPFSSRVEARAGNNNDTWAAWPNDNWAADTAWSKPEQKSDAWSSSKNTNTSSSDWKTDNWANKSDNWGTKTENWATDWGTDQNKNLNETWPSNTLPAKKEKSPKPVKYAKSLVHTIGGIGRTKQKEKKAKQNLEARSVEFLPSEEKQWAWAAAESKRLEAEAEERRRQEEAELQLALAISRQEK